MKYSGTSIKRSHEVYTTMWHNGIKASCAVGVEPVWTRNYFSTYFHRAKRGDLEAFADLVNLFRGRGLSICGRNGVSDRMDAEDLVRGGIRQSILLGIQFGK